MAKQCFSCGWHNSTRAHKRTRQVNEADLALFIQKYGRKSQKRREPNDRHYDPDIERILKRMAAEDVDRLLHGGDA